MTAGQVTAAGTRTGLPSPAWGAGNRSSHGYGRAVIRLAAVVACLVAVSACAGDGAARLAVPTPRDRVPTATPSPSASEKSPNDTTAPTAPREVVAPEEPLRPAWLGTRPLPLRGDGFGEVLPTPPELRDRRLPSPDHLPPPPDGRFHGEVHQVPPAVLERSTWSAGCPVAVADLRYLTVSFHGFDGEPHTGELLVHASAAEDVLEVFRRLHETRFPIEEMRVVETRELDAPPTGDGNNTTAFVCRPTRGSTRWSQHAYGLAVDVNPFHNPYVKDDLVLPELASAYTDRSWRRPGMIVAGDEVTRAFASIGWEWGGEWTRPKDPMHFSRDGR